MAQYIQDKYVQSRPSAYVDSAYILIKFIFS